jgi:hypothetical protein
VRSITGLALIGLLTTSVAAEAPADVRARVDYHVRQATELAEHFDDVIKSDCPRFGNSGEWQAYVDDEISRMVLMAAHVEQAWVEAKTTGDDEVRQAAKVPRKRLSGARPLLSKLQSCAEDNGATLSVASVWQRIDREVPRRQAEIALPR